MIRRWFNRRSFERRERQLCETDQCSVITPVGVKSIGYCGRCGREYLYLVHEKVWIYAGTKRRVV